MYLVDAMVTMIVLLDYNNIVILGSPTSHKKPFITMTMTIGTLSLFLPCHIDSSIDKLVKLVAIPMEKSKLMALADLRKVVELMSSMT